jgi:hypothetical protein
MSSVSGKFSVLSLRLSLYSSPVPVGLEQSSGQGAGWLGGGDDGWTVRALAAVDPDCKHEK